MWLRLAILVLLEFALLLPVYLYAFGVYKIIPTENTSVKIPDPHKKWSFLIFLRNTFRLFDVLGYLSQPFRKGSFAKISAVASEEMMHTSGTP